MKLMVCGTRKKVKLYQVMVFLNLSKAQELYEDLEIIEGCCKDSADEYAEKWAEMNKVKLHHYPATSGTYLKRNVEMVDDCDIVVAFWDGYSYGTAHSIAQAVLLKKPVEIIYLREQKR